MKKSRSDIIALFVSDLHLSHNPPIWRSNEPDWYAAMQRPLDELASLQKRCGNVPIFCAGDIFDKWYGADGKNASTLINWTMEHLPFLYAIPGQHDLPDHNAKQVTQSAFWTLKESGRIEVLFSDDPYPCGNEYYVTGYWFGESVFPCEKSEFKEIALIHQYNYVPGFEYEGAPETQCVSKRNRPEFEGYDWVISGDNHNPFIHEGQWTRFVNCGAIMQRKSDDRFRPAFWMLRNDGSFKRQEIDTSKDVHLDASEPFLQTTESVDMDELVSELSKLGDARFDFAQTLIRHIRKQGINKRIEDVLRQALGV